MQSWTWRQDNTDIKHGFFHTFTCLSVVTAPLKAVSSSIHVVCYLSSGAVRLFGSGSGVVIIWGMFRPFPSITSIASTFSSEASAKRLLQFSEDQKINAVGPQATSSYTNQLALNWTAFQVDVLNCCFQSTSATLNFCFHLFVDDKMLIVSSGHIQRKKKKKELMRFYGKKNVYLNKYINFYTFTGQVCSPVYRCVVFTRVIQH